LKNAKNQNDVLAAAAATIVNVPLVVNVCIVCPPLVVFVPHVEDGETQSDQSVAYEIITIQSEPAHQALFHHAHQPEPVFAVALLPVVAHAFHHPQLHHAHCNHHHNAVHHPHQAYVTEEPLIEEAVPLHHAHQFGVGPEPVHHDEEDPPPHHQELLIHDINQSHHEFHCQEVHAAQANGHLIA
jgi:hypothetical protein